MMRKSLIEAFEKYVEGVERVTLINESHDPYCHLQAPLCEVEVEVSTSAQRENRVTAREISD
jgi:hypothetical protein